MPPPKPKAPPRRRDTTLERLRYYLAGVGIGLMLLGMAALAWQIRQRQAASQPAPPAAPTIPARP